MIGGDAEHSSQVFSDKCLEKESHIKEGQVSERKKSPEENLSDGRAPFYINFDEILKQDLFDLKISLLSIKVQR